MSITQKVLKNGLTVIVEELRHVETAAYELYIPGGILGDVESKVGESLIAGEMLSRGAGSYDARALSEKFEEHGIRHGEGAGYDRFSFRGGMLKEKLPHAFELISLMLQSPRFPEEELEASQSLYLQELKSIDDAPARKAAVELSKRYYPAPFSRPSLGTEEGIGGTSIQSIQDLWRTTCKPSGAALAVAGNVDPEEVIKLAEGLFGGIQGEGKKFPKFATLPPRGQKYHIQKESNQVQIVTAQPSASSKHELYYPVKVLNDILSGGMYGRMFIEVREKRGLCYSVYYRHSSSKEFGTATMYAGTTPERAAETLKVMQEVVATVHGTVTPDELARAKINLKASHVIGEETPGARVGGLISDWWHRGRVRPLAELEASIDAVTVDQIDEALKVFPSTDFTVLTLGSKEIW
jgi:predicted Zn-dependent peptidase